MKIVYLADSINKYLQVTDTQLDSFALIPSNYLGIHVKGTINNGTPIELTINTSDITSTSGVFYVDLISKILFVTPSFFGLASFVDSIVKLEIKVLEGVILSPGGGYYSMQNCIFIDVTFKCKVAGLLQNIVEERDNTQDKEKISTFIHLMHYGLVNGSNCGCNCNELVDLFVELSYNLTNVDPITVNPCGCE